MEDMNIIPLEISFGVDENERILELELEFGLDL
jgi:hypothetical protein